LGKCRKTGKKCEKYKGDSHSKLVIDSFSMDKNKESISK